MKSGILFLAIFSLGVSVVAAQQVNPIEPDRTESSIVDEISQSVEDLVLRVSSSRILSVEGRIPRFQVHNEEVLGAKVVSENKIQVYAKSPGTTQLNLWDANDKLYTVNATVIPVQQPPRLTQLIQLKHVDPKEAIRVIEQLGLDSDELSVAVGPNGNELIWRGSGQALLDVKTLIQNIDVPAETTARQTTRQNSTSTITVTLNKSGQVTIDGREPTVDEYEDLLSPKSNVEIDVDPTASHADVARTMNRLRKFGVERISLRVRSQGNSSSLSSSSRQTSKGNTSTQSLRSAYEAAERSAATLAAQWRREKNNESPDSKALADLESQLSDEVQAAFRLRQQWQLEQLEEQRRDIDRLNERLVRRERIADQIVKHRVRELQSGKDLTWLAADETAVKVNWPVPHTLRVRTKANQATPPASTSLTSPGGFAVPEPDTSSSGLPKPVSKSAAAERLRFATDGETLTITGGSPPQRSQVEQILRSRVPSESIFKSDIHFITRIPDAETRQKVADSIQDIIDISARKQAIKAASEVPIYLYGPAGTKVRPRFTGKTVDKLPVRFSLDQQQMHALEVLDARGNVSRYLVIKIHKLSQQALSYFQSHELPLLLSGWDLERIWGGDMAGRKYYLQESVDGLRLQSYPISDHAQESKHSGELVAELHTGNRPPKYSKDLPTQAPERQMGKRETGESVLFVEMIVSQPRPGETTATSRKAIYMDGTVVSNDGLVAVVMDELLDDQGKLEVKIQSITLKTEQGDVIHDAEYMIHDPTSQIGLLQSHRIPVPALRLDGPKVVDLQGVAILGRARKDPAGTTVFEQEGWSLRTQARVPTREDVNHQFAVPDVGALTGSAVTLTTTDQLVGILTKRRISTADSELRHSGVLALPVQAIDSLVLKFRDQQFKAAK